MRFKAAYCVSVLKREFRAVVFGVEHLHVFRKRVLLCFLRMLRLHFRSKFRVFCETHEGCFKHSTVSTAQIAPSQKEDEQSLTAIHAWRTGLWVYRGVIYYQCCVRFWTLQGNGITWTLLTSKTMKMKQCVNVVPKCRCPKKSTFMQQISRSCMRINVQCEFL